MQLHVCRHCKAESFSAASPEDSLYGCPVCGGKSSPRPLEQTTGDVVTQIIIINIFDRVKS